MNNFLAIFIILTMFFAAKYVVLKIDYENLINQYNILKKLQKSKRKKTDS
jgi:hypothetical protein